MKEIKTIEKAVTLVTLPQYLPVIMRPRIGEYENPYVLRTRPCEKKQGKFFDLRTGEEIKKTTDMVEWNNLTGSLFRYPDGYELTLSRRYRDNKILVLEVGCTDEHELHSFIPRPIIQRAEKKF